MRRRLLLWFFPAGAGLLAAGVFAAGAFEGLRGRLGRPIGPMPAPTAAPASAVQAGVIHVVALGDSLTRGAGDEGGGGYPRRVADALKRGGRSASLANLGVDGIETADLLKKLAAPDVRREIASAGLLLVSISGNDLTHALPSGFASGGSDVTAAALPRARENLAAILRELRAANPTAPIRLLGLYSPFADAGGERLAKESLLAWNVALEEASFRVPGALVVPTFDLFEERPDRLSADRFHPGPSGYSEIAARVLSTLPTSLVPRPERQTAR